MTQNLSCVRNATSSLPDDIRAGLCATRKSLPCRLLYDARGAELFEQICTVEDYYLTRAELALLEAHLGTLAAIAGPHARVLEPGSGAGRKTRMLLSALDRPAVYVPIDVSREQLEDNARALRAEYPGLEVRPLHGDYTGALAMPGALAEHARTLVFFPGSTIGNFEPAEAQAFLARFGVLAGPNALLVLGADSNDDEDSLLRAYDDRDGVTAAFDLNVLAHLNRDYGATFDLAAFVHRATWNAVRSRVEMHLVSRRRQTVWVGGERIELERGEPIITEHCYKHRSDVLETLLARSGWQLLRMLPDPDGRMRLWLAERVAA
jgi:dimethylhistidine N-methyltransferase